MASVSAEVETSAGRLVGDLGRLVGVAGRLDGFGELRPQTHTHQSREKDGGDGGGRQEIFNDLTLTRRDVLSHNLG